MDVPRNQFVAIELHLMCKTQTPERKVWKWVYSELYQRKPSIKCYLSNLCSSTIFSLLFPNSLIQLDQMNQKELIIQNE